MSSKPLLRLERVRKRFGAFEALSSISLTLESGLVYGLAGENGAGKSTLVKILCGVHTDFEGQMFFRGEPYRANTIKESEHAGIIVFHQEMPICPSLSVAANVFLGPQLSDRRVFPDWRKLEARCEELFHDLLGMEFNARRLMGECSVAERQLALLVRVLSRQAKLIILDEPTTALTPPEVERLFAVLNRLRSHGITLLFVSHLLDELVQLSDEIFVLRDGMLAGNCRPGEFDAHDLAQLIAGRDLVEPAFAQTNRADIPKLEVRGMRRSGEFRDVSFCVHSGEVVGITGLQGSGRTGVVRALFGAPPADEGEILLNGKSLLIRSPSDAVANRIGYVPEDRQTLGLFDDLDVKSNLGILRRHSLARLGLLSGESLRELTFRMQRKLQIKFSGPDSRIGSLSGGNQQKILIGRWLLLEPEVLVMNEPTRGVDVGSKNEICRLIRSLAAEGCSFVVSSSDLDELMQLADRVLVMNSGRITAQFSHGTTRKKDLIHAVGAATPSEA